MISNTSINLIPINEANQYLDNLYNRLASDKVFTIPKSYQPINENTDDNDIKNNKN